MREKIVRIVCWHKPNWIPYEQFTKEDRDFGLPKADQILSYQREEIEKVENPYKEGNWGGGREGLAWNTARERILALLK